VHCHWGPGAGVDYARKLLVVRDNSENSRDSSDFHTGDVTSDDAALVATEPKKASKIKISSLECSPNVEPGQIFVLEGKCECLSKVTHVRVTSEQRAGNNGSDYYPTIAETRCGTADHVVTTNTLPTSLVEHAESVAELDKPIPSTTSFRIRVEFRVPRAWVPSFRSGHFKQASLLKIEVGSMEGRHFTRQGRLECAIMVSPNSKTPEFLHRLLSLQTGEEFQSDSDGSSANSQQSSSSKTSMSSSDHQVSVDEIPIAGDRQLVGVASNGDPAVDYRPIATLIFATVLFVPAILVLSVLGFADPISKIGWTSPALSCRPVDYALKPWVTAEPNLIVDCDGTLRVCPTDHPISDNPCDEAVHNDSTGLWEPDSSDLTVFPLVGNSRVAFATNAPLGPPLGLTLAYLVLVLPAAWFFARDVARDGDATDPESRRSSRRALCKSLWIASVAVLFFLAGQATALSLISRIGGTGIKTEDLLEEPVFCNASRFGNSDSNICLVTLQLPEAIVANWSRKTVIVDLTLSRPSCANEDLDAITECRLWNGTKGILVEMPWAIPTSDFEFQEQFMSTRDDLWLVSGILGAATWCFVCVGFGIVLPLHQSKKGARAPVGSPSDDAPVPRTIETYPDLLTAIQATNGGPPLVLQLKADWCEPCHQLRPRMANVVASQYDPAREDMVGTEPVLLALVDVDVQSKRLSEAVRRLGSGPVPEVLPVIGGVVRRDLGFLGCQTATDIEEFLAKVRSEALLSPSSEEGEDLSSGDAVSLVSDQSSSTDSDTPAGSKSAPSYSSASSTSSDGSIGSIDSASLSST
jgi:thiol-disulfide isomerase/thioredoxin